MKSLFRIFLFILICWFGYNAFKQTLRPQESGLFAGFQYLELIILVILSLITIASDIVAYRSFPRLFQFYGSIAGLFLCTIIFLRLFTFYKIENSMTVYEFSSKAGAENVLSLHFKEHGYLRIEEFHRLGQNIYYGIYHHRGDTFIITETNYEKLFQKLPDSALLQSGYLIVNKKDSFHLEKVRVR